MRLLWVLLLLHLCLHSITACGDEWIWINSLKKCYFISVMSTDWDDAKSNCQRKNSRLVSLDENITKFMKILIGNNKSSNYWIGNVNNTVPVKLSNGKTCYAINSRGVEIRACDEENGYICQRDGSKMIYKFYDACIQKENLTCYWITRTMKQFIEANNHCSDEDGHLVHVYDRKEEYFIYSLISLNYENNGGKYWLDWNKEGKWINNTFKLSKDSFTLSEETCSAILFNKSNFLKISVKSNSFAYAICQKTIKTYLIQSSDCISCPVSWFSYGSTDKCYWISNNQTRNWLEARSYCQNFGGDLITYTSKEEENFILSIMSETLQDYWIGLNYSFSRYKWTEKLGDATIWMRRNFKELNGTEGSNKSLCVFYSQKAKEWLHEDCELSKGFICKGGKKICDKEWKLFNGNCYKIESSLAFTWHRALMYCKDNNGSLSSIHSTEELQFLSRMIRETNSNELFWIGLYQNGRYLQWSDSSPIQFLLDGLPEGEDERCASLNFTGKWFSHDCNIKKRFICKKSVNFDAMLSTTTETLLQEEECPEVWLHFGNKCYLYVKGKNKSLSWMEANRQCSSLESHLTTIQNSNEQEFLTFLLVYFEKNAWIGFNSLKNDQTFTWTDNSSIDYTNWNKDKLSDLETKRCVEILAPNSKDEFIAGKWNPASCNSHRSYFCEKKISSIQMTSLTTLQSLETCNKPRDWIKFKNRCYKMINSSNSWLKADFQCRKYNAHLVTISNSSFNVFIQFTKKIFKISYKWTEKLGDATIWMRRNFKELNGTEGSNKSLCVFYSQKAKEWLHEDCELSKGFICKGGKKICDKEWKLFNGNCYKIESSLAFTWHRALMYCKDNNGSLSSIHSTEELQFLSRMIRETNSNELFWIGLYQNGRYLQWSDSSPIQFLLDGLPEGEDERCASLNFTGKWFSHDCNIKKRFICKKSVNFDAMLSTTTETLLQEEECPEKRFRYKWISGWPVLFTNWGKDQPGKEGLCSIMLPSGQWMTKSCLENFPFVCETTPDLLPSDPSDRLGLCSSKSDGWMDLGKKCYYFEGKALVSLSEAKLECLRKDSELISLHSVEDINIVSKYIKYTSTSYWIGLVRKQDGSFSWTDYSPVNFVYWDDNQPADNYRDNCVEMHRKRKTWSMVDCKLKRGYICTKKKNETIRETKQMRLYTKNKKINNKSFHPGIIVVITVVCISVMICMIYLIIICIKKTRKKETPIITDSNEETMTYSNVAFVDEYSEDSSDVNRNQFGII
ncbi:macrophage mannose receptor 1-like [Centruroides sculpturatus]|uniref:macrophage mannose receptor 1-like n=1 Tax=Centruroides sculpturatus TaxID=218467 RepID=UPI000C6D853B|nr:macrophage mannose receptor 1-like [Centruroides sculpturatus]